MDSGCEIHCTREEAAFQRRDRHTPFKLGQANGDPLVTAGQGVAHGLENVILVPDLDFPGLLSTALITDADPATSVLYTKDAVHIAREVDALEAIRRAGGKIDATGTRVRNIYVIDPRDVASKRRKPIAFDSGFAQGHGCLALGALEQWRKSTNALLRAVIWTLPGKHVNRARVAHERLNHVPYETLLEWQRKGRVQGLDFTMAEFNAARRAFCGGCAAGRTDKKPRARKRTTPKATQAFGRIFIDLFFMPVPDRMGRTVGMFILDEYTHSSWVQFMHQKSEALDKFTTLMDQASRGFGVSEVVLPFKNPASLGAVQTDNGGEFRGEFVKYIESTGAKVERSTPMEGHVFAAERGIRSLKARTRCLLATAKMPDLFWSDAMVAALFVECRTPREDRNWYSPFELLTGQKPDLSMLRVWGAPCVIHVPASKRTGLEAAALAGRFIGYGTFLREYCVYVEETNRVYRRQSVYFDEDLVPRGGVNLEATERGPPDEDEEISISLPEPLQPELPAEPTPRSRRQGQLTPPPEIDPDDPDVIDSFAGPVDLSKIKGRHVRSPGGTRRWKTAKEARQEVIDNSTLRRNDDPPSQRNGHLEDSLRVDDAEGDEAAVMRGESATGPAPTPRLTRSGRRFGVNQLRGEPAGKGAQFEILQLIKTFARTSDTHDIDAARLYSMLNIARPKPGEPGFVYADQVEIPATMKEATDPSNPYYKEWIKARDVEVAAFFKNGVIGSIAPVAEVKKAGHKIVKTKTVLTCKPDENGGIKKMKMRVVAKGCSSIPGLHYDETALFAPTAKMDSIRLLFTIIAILDLEVMSADISTAFLTSDLDIAQWIYCPDGFEHVIPPGFCALLVKSMYGLKSSPALFRGELDEHLREHCKFTATKSDPCFYVRRGPKRRDGSQDICLICTVVDDLIIGYSGDISPLLQQLQDQYNITSEKKLEYVLGMEVKRDRKARRLWLTQSGYIGRILRRYGMDGDDVKTREIPAPTDAKLSVTMCGDLPLDPKGGTNVVRQMVGSLLFAAVCTRPDIAREVSDLARFVSNPGKPMKVRGKDILRYLKKYPDEGICLGGRSLDSDHHWSDSDYGGDCACPEDTHRSRTSFYNFLGIGPVSWKSKLQATVAQSSCEAETVAACQCSNNVMWLRSLMGELGFPFSKRSLLFIDNKGAKDAARNPCNHKRMKHMHIKWHVLRERHQNGDLYVLWIDGDYNIADLGTKALPARRFNNLKDLIFARRRIEFPNKKDAYERRRIKDLIYHLYGS